MKKIFYMLFIFIIGCSSIDHKETDEYKKYEIQLSNSKSSLNDCIKKYVNKYASNKSASHSEVAEATVTRCHSDFLSMCTATIEMGAMIITNVNMRNKYKLGEVDSCVQSRSEIVRKNLVRDLVENRK